MPGGKAQDGCELSRAPMAATSISAVLDYAMAAARAVSVRETNARKISP
jgi:hypothetical protein